MVQIKRKIVWSPQALEDKLLILEYWRKKTRSLSYSRKLEKIFRHCFETIRTFPLIGLRTDVEHTRGLITGDYLLVYQILEKEIYVLRIWDCRQNPEEFTITVE